MKNPLLISFGLAAAIALAACGKKSVGTVGNTGTADVSFARATFESLARGDSSVETKIDWKTFKSLGIDIAGQYVIIKTEADQKGFRDGFITQFSASFRENGGKIERFTSWRPTEADALKTIVAADSPNGLLKITVTARDGVKRLSGLEMVK